MCYLCQIFYTTKGQWVIRIGAEGSDAVRRGTTSPWSSLEARFSLPRPWTLVPWPRVICLGLVGCISLLASWSSFVSITFNFWYGGTVVPQSPYCTGLGQCGSCGCGTQRLCKFYISTSPFSPWKIWVLKGSNWYRYHKDCWLWLWTSGATVSVLHNSQDNWTEDVNYWSMWNFWCITLVVFNSHLHKLSHTVRYREHFGTLYFCRFAVKLRIFYVYWDIFKLYQSTALLPWPRSLGLLPRSRRQLPRPRSWPRTMVPRSWSWGLVPWSQHWQKVIPAEWLKLLLHTQRPANDSRVTFLACYLFAGVQDQLISHYLADINTCTEQLVYHTLNALFSLPDLLAKHLWTSHTSICFGFQPKPLEIVHSPILPLFRLKARF